MTEHCVCHVLGREGCRYHSYTGLEARIAALEGALRLHNLTPTGKVRRCLPGCIACALVRPAQNSYLIDQDFDE